MAGKTSQKPQEAHAPSPRTPEAIQTEFAQTMRQKAVEEAEREKRLSKQFSAFRKAEDAYKASKKILDLAIADDPATGLIGKLNAKVDDLKIEASDHWEPMAASTYRDQDGAGFQYRSSVKTVIANEEVLAQALIEKHLWQDIGASLSVSTAKAAHVLKTHSLPGLSVEPQVTVAAYGPSKE